MSAPSTPTNVVATYRTHRVITASWVAASDGGSPITGYLVKYGSTVVPTGTDATSVSFAVPATVFGQVLVSVAAVNADGTSAYSDVFAVEVDTASYPVAAVGEVIEVAPTALALTFDEPDDIQSHTATNLRASLVGPDIHLSWTAPSAGLPDHYEITAYSGKVEISDESPISDSATDHTLSGLAGPFSQYTFMVDAYFGTTPFQSNGFTVIPSPPGAPTGLSADTLTSSGATINWTAAAQGTEEVIKGYVVSVYRVSDGQLHTYWAAGASTTTLAVAGLDSATEYGYIVTTSSTVGEGPQAFADDTFTTT